MFTYIVVFIGLFNAYNCHLHDNEDNVELIENMKSAIRLNLAMKAIDEYFDKYTQLVEQLYIDEKCVKDEMLSETNPNTDDEHKLNLMSAFSYRISPIDNEYFAINTKLDNIRHYSRVLYDPDEVFRIIKQGEMKVQQFLRRFFEDVNKSLKNWMERSMHIYDNKLGRTYYYSRGNYTQIQNKILIQTKIPFDEKYQFHSYAQIQALNTTVSRLQECTKSVQNLCIMVFERIPELKLSPNVNQRFCDTYSLLLNIIEDILPLENYKEMPNKSLETYNNNELDIVRNRVDIEKKLANINPIRKFLNFPIH